MPFNGQYCARFALSRIIAAVLVVLAMGLSACSGGLPHAVSSPAGNDIRPSDATPAGNLFGHANGLMLRDADLDVYITTSLSPSDRRTIHILMAMMPATQRGDLTYVTRDGRVLSNSTELLTHVVYRRGGVLPMSAKKSDSGVRHLANYSSSCAPPAPSGGAFFREVSRCGYTTGWGFVNVPCGFTSFAPSDDGELYMELTGTAGSLTEGGLQYNNDQSVQPYARMYTAATGSNYLGLNNASAKYACGQNLAVMHGSTSNGQMIYTEVGVLPSNLDPNTNWVNYGTFTLNNAAWNFFDGPGDINGGGYDPAGDPTPCTNCSISQVTALAQNGLPDGEEYQEDGSFFGVSQSLGAEIDWMQVAFGQYESNCVQGTSLCTFLFSRNISLYAGGPQAIPEGANAVFGYPNPLGWGPYNTYDGVDLSNGNVYEASEQRAAQPFTEPSPPPPCTADSSGYCYTSAPIEVVSSITCTTAVHVPEKITTGTLEPFFVYQGATLLEEVIYTRTFTQSCNPTLVSQTWSPGEPRVQYGDANLP